MFDKLIQQFPRATYIMLTVFVVLIVIRLLSGGTIGFNESLAWQFLYTMLYGYSLYFSNAVLFIKLDDIYQTNRFSKKRIITGFAVSFIVSLLIIFLLRILEDVIIEGRNIHAFIVDEKPSNYFISIIITFVITLGIHAFYFYKAYQENKLKEQKIIANVASAQFESLKNQIDPHFLFNSLNVLSSLIEENPENAQKFTTSLSKVYRYVLEQKDKELISVAEELQFAKTYMNLLKMRFENSITFEIPELAANEEAKVVPLSLQLILENCIKHNVVSATKPLHVKISVANNELIITNNLQKKEVLQDRKGVGLQNIVNRYAILTNRKVKIQETTATFSVHLPLLTKQITIMENTTTYNEIQAYEKAKKRVKDIKEFYGNLISYVIVIPVLIIINLKTYSKFQWFWFPMFGWGLVLLFLGLSVFGYGKSWEERKIQEILDKEKNSQNQWQ